jgi:hypothetical protein
MQAHWNPWIKFKKLQSILNFHLAVYVTWSHIIVPNEMRISKREYFLGTFSLQQPRTVKIAHVLLYLCRVRIILFSKPLISLIDRGGHWQNFDIPKASKLSKTKCCWSGSVGSICFWASLGSLYHQEKIARKINSYCFATSLWHYLWKMM